MHILPTMPWVGVLSLSCDCLSAASLAHGAVDWCVLLSCGCLSAAPLAHGAVGWCVLAVV